MKKHILGTVLALPLALSTAYAQDGGNAIKVSGFGTGALTWTDTDDAQFARMGQPSGAGKQPVTYVDSNLGLQADAQINDWLSVTAQGLVRKSGEDHYGAEATLAFAKIKLSDNLSVRVGRTGLAVFMISDFRNVGYANIMLRAPQEVYGQVPHVSIDGADVTWQQNIGSTTVTAQAAYGSSVDTPAGGGRALVTDHSAVGLTVEHGPVSVRLSRDDGKLTVDNPYFHIPKTKVSFTSAGVALDWNNLIVQSEYAIARMGGDESPSWYAMTGYRLGKFVPYYTRAKVSGNRGNQHTDTIGLRWDALRSAALKFQIDRISPQGHGQLIAVKPGFRGPVTVGAVSVDFVF